MKIKHIYLFIVGAALLAVFIQPTVNVYAQADCSGLVNEELDECLAENDAPAPRDSESTCPNQRFLTFPAWYRGVVDGECNITSPAEHAGGFPGFIWNIALNLVEIILNAVGYAAVGFIIYGGYKYMISAGSPDGMVGARKTIMNASIGLIISIAAIGIVNAVVNAF